MDILEDDLLQELDLQLARDPHAALQELVDPVREGSLVSLLDVGELVHVDMPHPVLAMIPVKQLVRLRLILESVADQDLGLDQLQDLVYH